MALTFFERLALWQNLIVIDEPILRRGRFRIEEDGPKQLLLDLLKHSSLGDKSFWLRCDREEELVPEVREIPHTTLRQGTQRGAMRQIFAFNDNHSILSEEGKVVIATSPLPEFLIKLIFGHYHCVVIIPKLEDRFFS